MLLLENDAVSFEIGMSDWQYGQVAFVNIKAKLCSFPVFTAYAPTFPIDIRSGASGQGIGAILLQINHQNDIFGVMSCLTMRLQILSLFYSV